MMQRLQKDGTSSTPPDAESAQGGPKQRKATPEKTRSAESGDGAKLHKVSRKEWEAIFAFAAKNKNRPPAPRMKVSEKDGLTRVALDHPEPAVGEILLTQALGANDFDFFHGILNQLENATTGDTVNERQLNFMLSVIRGINPSDQVEAMIGAQMAVVHRAFMSSAHLLAKATYLVELEGAERALAKLGRTFATQVEALKRYRGTGEHKPREEKVKCSMDDLIEAANAELNGVQPAATDRFKANGHSNGKASHAPQPAMRSPNPERPTVPVTCDAERPLPHARRHVAGGTQRK
jgi:hypothetical protein